MARWLLDLFFIVVVFLTNIVQAITGFAGTALAMPFSILLVGYDVAKPTLNAIALLLCIYLVIRYHKDINWKNVLYITIFTGIGMALGMILKQYLYSKDFLKFYGMAICLLSTFFLVSPRQKKYPLWINIIILFIGGFIHGIFVSGGPLLILALSSRIKSKEEFRSTLAIVWVILNSVLLTQDLINGSWNLEMLYLFLIMIPTVLLSIFIGKKLFKKLNNNSFMKVAYALLFVSGFILLC